MDEGIRQNLSATQTADSLSKQCAQTASASSASEDNLSASLHLVSVIIPLYNMEEFVEETLRSVLTSSYRNIEVIVVDDGSTDASPRIVAAMAAQDARVMLLQQENAGPSCARNKAVAASQGRYILPVDADNLLAPQFIAQAVRILETQPSVKVVRPTMEFIGDKQGLWQLPEFSLALLARRNHIDTCALYRRVDFDRVGGYCETIIAREDWDFWIAVLKDGGDVVRLPEVGYYYRVRKQSKRIRDRKLKAHVTAVLNQRYRAFFEEQLGGPLRRMRSWSRWINFLTRPLRYCKVVTAEGVASTVKRFVDYLPWRFSQEGREIFKNRNAIRQYELGDDSVVVKQFTLPIAFNRFVYRWLRKSKAQRSYEYAMQLRALGVGSPEPLGFCDTGSLWQVGYCYYASRTSKLRYNYHEAVNGKQPDEDKFLRTLAKTVARMHEGGFWHKDLSGNNILWDRVDEGGNPLDATASAQDDYKIAIELIDLNRMRLGKVSLELGCANFQRIGMSEKQQMLVAETYAAERGFDAKECFQHIVAARNRLLRR